MKEDGHIKTGLISDSFELAFKNCIPLATTLEITQHCNLSCKHCYNFDRSKSVPEEIVNNYLTPVEIIQTIDEVADLGTLYLNLSGGEALLHPHLVDFVKRATSWNMEVRLKSNGLLFTDKKLTLLKEAGLKGVDLSLYGSNNETYNAFSRVQHGYDQFLKGLNLLIKAGMHTHINIILHKGNVNELEEMITLCEEFQVSFQLSIEVTDRYDGSKGARDYEVTEKQFEQLLLGKHGKLFMAFNDSKSTQCSCARSVCGINAAGDVYPCIGAPIKAGNIKDKKLKDIWQNSSVMTKIRNLKQEDFKECMSCSYIETCDRSSGSCYVNTGNYTGCDDKVLAQAKIRAKHKNKFID